jgi:glycopeptide antibiotics resistance protein
MGVCDINDIILNTSGFLLWTVVSMIKTKGAPAGAPKIISQLVQ